MINASRRDVREREREQKINSEIESESRARAGKKGSRSILSSAPTLFRSHVFFFVRCRRRRGRHPRLYIYSIVHIRREREAQEALALLQTETRR